MANWKFTLDIHKVCSDKELSIQDKGEAIAKEIVKTFPVEWTAMEDPNAKTDNELCHILKWFTELKQHCGHSIVNDYVFDGIMECLYDWADQEIEPLGMWPLNKMCWIKTHSHM